MRAVLARVLPGIEIIAGSAEEIPLASEAVDGVFVAEAFHRFNGESALSAIARVLRPHGALTLMWNIPAGNDHPDVAAAERLLLDRAPGSRQELGYDPVDLNPHRLEAGDWRQPFVRSPFEEPREVRLPNPQTVDRDGLLAFYASMGWIGNMPKPDREALLEEMRPLLKGAQYQRSWETRLFLTRLR
jgi:hypothetical protein